MDKRKHQKRTKANKYKRYCKMRYYIILSLYLWEELSKNYAYLAPLLLVFGVLGKTAVIIATPIAITGSLVAFIAKTYQLKNMKFRRRNFYRRKNNVEKIKK